MTRSAPVRRQILPTEKQDGVCHLQGYVPAGLDGASLIVHTPQRAIRLLDR